MKLKHRTASTKRHISRLVLPIITAAFVMSGAPAQAAPVAASSATASDITQISQAVPQGLTAPFGSAAEQVAHSADRRQFVIPIAIAAALKTCAQGAALAVGIDHLKRLIFEGKDTTARDLLIDSLVGCVSGVGGLAIRTCLRLPPCKRALQDAARAAADSILWWLRGGGAAARVTSSY